MTSARKPRPIPDSNTVKKRPIAECGTTSPRPSVKSVVPLMYSVVRKLSLPSGDAMREPAPHCISPNASTMLTAQSAMTSRSHRGP